MKRSRCRDRPQPPPPPPPLPQAAGREDGAQRAAELPQPQPLPPRRRAPPGRQRLEERTGPVGPEVREQDVVTGRSPLLFRKLSNPDIFSSAGKAKLQRQLSQDDCKLRRGSLASSLSGKQLLPLSGSAHSSVGQVTWQSSGEASNLVRMRNQSLGQSAPSLTAGLEVPIKNSVLLPKTNLENLGRPKGGGRRWCVLPTVQKPSHWNPSWLREAQATRKDSESEEIWAKQDEWPETTRKLILLL